MMNRYLPLLALVSFSAFAEVSFEEKTNRIEYLEELSKEAVSMNIDAYRRELQYERQNLSLEKRAENEANLLVERIKVQIQNAYEVALEEKSPEEAAAEVRAAFEKDLELVDPQLKDEIRMISNLALEGAQRGSMNVEFDLTHITNIMLKGVEDRHRYFNEESNDLSDITASFSATKAGNDANRKSYSSRKQLVDSLVSNRDSASSTSNANMTLKGENVLKKDARIDLQVNIQFLGASLDAGPMITFSRQYKTSANFAAEGMTPIILPDGNFDFWKRDMSGSVLVSNGKPQKRELTFNCDASLEFATEYSGAGGFYYLGLGGGASISKRFASHVALSSRKIAVPETIEGKSATIKYLNQICHSDFLNGKVTNTMTVAKSLNIMMKNVVAGLRFSHPKTKCVSDTQCGKWFKNEVLGLMKLGNTARCVEDSREKFLSCELRGLKGQACSVFDKSGKRVSSGVGEFKCDKGLTCVKTQDEGWLTGWRVYQHAKGKCMPTKR